MDKTQINNLKKILLEELKDKKEGLESKSDLEITELSNYDNHPGDIASELYEKEKEIALKVHNKEELKDVDEALEKIGKNNYGICDFCGKEIGFQRLLAMPTAKLCIGCQENRTIDPNRLENDRPIEEEVLMYPFGRTFTDGEDSVVYDGEDTWQDVGSYGSSSGPQDISVNRPIDYENSYYDSDEDK